MEEKKDEAKVERVPRALRLLRAHMWAEEFKAELEKQIKNDDERSVSLIQKRMDASLQELSSIEGQLSKKASLALTLNSLIELHEKNYPPSEHQEFELKWLETAHSVLISESATLARRHTVVYSTCAVYEDFLEKHKQEPKPES